MSLSVVLLIVGLVLLLGGGALFYRLHRAHPHRRPGTDEKTESVRIGVGIGTAFSWVGMVVGVACLVVAWIVH